MTLSDLTISPARPADLHDIHKMIRALSAFHGDEATVTLAHLQEIFFGPTPQATALVAKTSGQAVAYAGITPTIVLHEGTIRLDIHHLFVAERNRAKGIGQAMIIACKAYARDIGATRLTIGTDPENATAIAAYRAMETLTEITGTGPRFRVDLGA